ncbi:MAG: hypothetical protein KDN20_17000 [Verrucomicrobiae bacterium]|nr:hypothetical protein [Verrucomicrobiae bacterium]
MKAATQSSILAWAQMRFGFAGLGLLTIFSFSIDGAAQETVPAVDPALPPSLEANHFEALMGNSPFLRTLNLSETYALRGIAEIDGEQVATLYNRETKKSIIVSGVKVNAEQMKLVAVSESEALDGISATIAVAGEEVDLKFELDRVAPKPKNPKGGSGPSNTGVKKAEEPRRGPSKEDMERYQALSDAQKEKFRDYIRQTMQKYPDMSREERGNMIRGAMTRLSDGHDISVESSSTNGGGGPPPPSSSSRGSSDRR